MSSLTISPSQISRADQCLRQWAWDREIPRGGPTEDMRLGTDVHQVLENYALAGTAPDRATIAGRIAMPALEFIPPPLVGRPEHRWRGTFAGLSFQGVIDRELPDQIWDYKTKKKFDRYDPALGRNVPNIHTERQDFLDDPQALLYAMHAGRPVELVWLYLKTTGQPEAKRVGAHVSVPEVQAAFERRVLPRARVLVTIRERGLRPLDLPPNPGQCLKYGADYACPYIARCNLTPMDKLTGEANMAEVFDDLLAELQAKVQVNPPEAAPAVQAMATPAPTTPTVIPDAGLHAVVLPGPSRAPTPVVSDAQLGAAVRVLLLAWKGQT